jgi:hypothetical protein
MGLKRDCLGIVKSGVAMLAEVALLAVGALTELGIKVNQVEAAPV